MASNVTMSLEQRAKMRQRNKNPALFRSELGPQSLKYDLKKATALAKRFRNYSAEASEKAILSQLPSISFGMFLSEAAQNVVHSLCRGTKMKIADAHSFAIVCSEVHQRYEAFWPSVRQSLREHAERILDVESLRAEIERVEETATGGASVAVPGPTNTGASHTTAVDTFGSTAAVMSASANANALGSSGNSVNPGAGAGVSSAMEELTRLRLIARVFCEWFLLGLIDDAGPLLNILKLLNAFLTRWHSAKKGGSAAIANSATVVSSLVAVAVLIVREVGIEIFDNANAALPLLLPAGTADDPGDSLEQFRKLSEHCGALAPVGDSGKAASAKTNTFQLGPAGVRVIFSAAVHSAVPVDDTAARCAVKVSLARLRDAENRTLLHAYATIEEREQFATFISSIARTAVDVYYRCRDRVQGAWRLLREQEVLRGRTARLVAAEARFRAYHEEVERLYAQCDALLGMMGYSPLEVIDLTRVTQKNATDVTITLRGQIAPGEAETVNRFANGELRLFYEYFPRLQALPEEMLPSLTSQKANWEPFTLRYGETLNNASSSNNTGKQTARNASVSGKVYDDNNLHESTLCNGEDGDYDDYEEYEEEKVEKVASTKKQSTAAHALARRRRHVSELGISPTEYEPILQLLAGLEQCNTAPAVDEWCEGYFQEAFRPLCHAENENAVSAARAFFTNCRVLLGLELRYFPATQWPEMLPYAARCLAIVHQYFPDTGEFVAGRMEGIWRGICRRGPAAELGGMGEAIAQRRVEGAVRYLCELMKFGVTPPIRVLVIVRDAVDNLQRRLVPFAVAAAIEHGGLFLMRGALTRPLMEKHLSKLRDRLQHVVLDEDALEVVKNSFVALQPPAPVRKPVVKTRPPLEEYARHLIFNELCGETYEEVLEQMLRMPWGDPDSAQMLLRTLRKTHHLAWDALPYLSDLLADLVCVGHTDAAHFVLGSLVEDMRRDLEFPIRTLTTQRPPSGPRASVGMEDQRLHPILAASLRACYRPMQWRTVDCQFIAQLYRARLVNLRFVALSLLILLHYAPPPIPLDDCARARCFVTLLGSCIGYLKWRSDPYGKGGEWSQAKSLSNQQLARMRWSVDRILAQQQIVRRLVGQLFLHIHNDIAGPLPSDLRYRIEGLLEAVNEAVGLLYKEAADEPRESKLRGILEGTTPPQALVLPETPEAARAFVTDVLEAEPLHSINEWYVKLRDAVLSGGTTCPFRLLTETLKDGHLASLSGGSLGLTRDGDGNSSNDGYVSAGNDDENPMDEESDEDEEDEEEEDEEEEDDDEEEEEDEEDGSEEDEEDEEEEEEEEEGEEEEENEPNLMQRQAVAAALRRQQEDEEFDAEIRALRGGRTRTITAKGAAAPQFLEKELSLGIRQHRQRHHQQQQQQQLPRQGQQEKEGEGNMMRFAVLQRHSGKAAVGTAQAGPVLCLPRESQFAQTVSAQHAVLQQHKEELRAITVRMTRMQEEEQSNL